MILLLLACSQPDPLLLVPDTGAGRLVLLQDDLRWYDEISLANVIHAGCEDIEDAAICMVFEVEHRVEDGEDYLLTSLATRIEEGAGAPGSIVDVWIHDGEAETHRAIRELDFSEHPELYDGICAPDAEPTDDTACALDMIHAARWMPDQSLLVASDTSNSRILWIRPEWDDRRGVVEVVLEMGAPGWERFRYPNGVHVWEEDGRVLLLSTFKSSDDKDVAASNTGRVVLWDVTDPYRVERLWAYPETGFLAAVHNAMVAEVQGKRYLLYAHSLGAAGDWLADTGGSVGVAQWNGIDAAPTYLGDGRAPDDDEPFGFLREVGPSADGTGLLILDSGCQVEGDTCESPTGVIRAALPGLAAPGKSGAYCPEHDHQRFFTFGRVERKDHGVLHAPYEVDALPRSSLGRGLSER